MEVKVTYALYGAPTSEVQPLANTVGVKCASLHLVIVVAFSINDNSPAFLGLRMTYLLFIVMHHGVPFCLSQSSPIRHGKIDITTHEEY